MPLGAACGDGEEGSRRQGGVRERGEGRLGGAALLYREERYGRLGLEPGSGREEGVRAPGGLRSHRKTIGRLTDARGWTTMEQGAIRRWGMKDVTGA